MINPPGMCWPFSFVRYKSGWVFFRELQETLEAHKFKPLIDAFWERESRICGDASAYHPLHDHALSRTSFEPYQNIPFYMSCPKNGGLRDYQLTGNAKQMAR